MSEFREIGQSLLEAAKTDFSARGVLTPLFPYIYEAAKTMSARAISRWLLDTHGVKLSDVTISKALRNPYKHWEAFADYVEPWARTVAKSIEPDMDSFLENGEVFEHFVSNPTLLVDIDQEVEEALDDFNRAADWLREHWFSLDPSVRGNCARYFRVPCDSEEADEK